MREYLMSLLNEIQDRKKSVLRLESLLLWLSGAWLPRVDLPEKPKSPFLVQASELVKGHYFEPAAVVESDSGCPHLDRGLRD